MKENINEQDAQKELEKGYKNAEVLLNDQNKMDEFLLKLEKKLEKFSLGGGALSKIPTMVSLVKSYVKKEYTEIPTGTIIAIISALIYFLSPVDLIPDVIPGVGYVDDAAVIIAL